MKRWHWIVLCLVFLSIGASLILPIFDKRFNYFNQNQIKEKETELDSLGFPYGNMPVAVTDVYNWQGTTIGRNIGSNGACRINNTNYYVTVAYGSGTDGWANVLYVWDNNGTIKKSVISSYEYDITDGYAANVEHIPGTDKYVVAYRDTTAAKVTVVTLQIWANNGTIKPSLIDSQQLTYNAYANANGVVYLQQVTNNVWAVAYAQVTSAAGNIETIWIDSTGMINNSLLDFENYAAYGNFPRMCLVDSNTIALLYMSATDNILMTYNISSAGLITDTPADSWAYEANQGYHSSINKVGTNVYDITYLDGAFDTYTKTITIANTGMITKSWIDTLTVKTDTAGGYIETFVVTDPQTAANGTGILGTTLQDSSGDGWIYTWIVNSAGVISATIIDSLEFNSTDSFSFAHTEWINKSYYFIIYTAANSEGWACTVQIDTNWASPTFANPSPANNSVDQALTPQCAITVNDLNGDAMTVNFYENSTGSYVLRQTNSSCANGTYRWTFAQATANSHKYYWKVYINDGTYNVSNWYCFTTEAPPAQEKTWQSLYNSTLTGGNITTIYRSLFTSLLSGGNITTIYRALFTSTLTGGNVTSTYKPLFTSTLTGGNISTTKSLFTSLLTGGNSTSGYRSLFTSLLTGGNITTGNKALFTSLLTGGNISTNTALFTSLLTGGNISSDKSLFTSLLTGGNITTTYKALFTSILTGGNISSGNWTSLFTSTLTGGNISSNHSFFTSLLSGGNITHPVSLWTSLLTGGNESTIEPPTPFNPNLYLINPNPGNGTHNTNYLKSNASGLATSIDIFYDNFTTPPALMPGSYSMTIVGSTPSNTPVIWNTSTTGVYNDVWSDTTGQLTPGNPWVGQYLNLGEYSIFRSFLIFDTSSIPSEAVIDSAYVRLVVYDADYTVDDFNVTLQMCRQPIPHYPALDVVDFDKHGYSSDMGHVNTSGYVDESVMNIELNPSGLNDILNGDWQLTDTVRWCLRSDRDIDAVAPVNDEFIILYGYGVDTAKYPKLIVNFTIPNSNWEHFVNLTWFSNSSGAWTEYYKSYVNSNGTATVPAINFSGIDTYYWHLEWESNHTNNGSSKIFTFTTVNAGSGHAVFIGDRDRFNMGFIIGATFFLMLGMILWKKKRKGI